MKRKTLLSILALAALLAMPQGVKADEVTATCTGVTYIQGDGTSDQKGDTNFNGTTPYLTTNCAGITDGLFNNTNSKYSGSKVVIVKFDASTQLDGKSLTKATLSFNAKSQGNSGNIHIALIGTTWEATTATWNNVNTDENNLMDATTLDYSVSQDASSDPHSLEVTTQLEADADKIIGFGIYGETRTFEISDIVLTLTVADAGTTANYTVNWTDGINTIKSLVKNGTIGEAPTLSDGDKASFYGTGSYYGQYYEYSSDDASSQTIANDGTTVVTVTCTTTEITTYSSGIAKTWAMIDNPTVWSARTAVGNYDGLAVTGTLSFDSGNGRYYLSADDALTFAVQEEGYLVISGKGGVKLYVYDTEEHLYDILSGSSGKVYTKLVSGSDKKIIRIVGPAGGTNSIFSVSWIPTSSSKSTATTSVTLDSHGFATYYPAYTVTLPADATAYYFKALDMVEGTVTGVEIAASGTIPANAAVLVKSTANAGSSITLTAKAGTENAININSASANNSDKVNDLYPAYSSTSQAEGYTYYAYAKNTGSFKKVKSDVSIPEGKCYFKLESTSSAREFLNIVFDDEETTGVNAVQRTDRNIQNGEYYNLSGQRVVNPTKGLYIVNGKKVIIK